MQHKKKSAFHSLHRIFSESIRAREIAEFLVSVDIDQSREKVSELMYTREYDVIGVSQAGHMIGYLKKEDLDSGSLSELVIKFQDEEILREDATLFDALNALSSKNWIFIRFLDTPSGIITRGDLQKTPMRLWLFGVISLLEMQLLRHIRRHYPEDSWKAYLSENRIAAAEKIFADRKKDNSGIDLAECLQIGDKKEIFAKSPILFPLVCHSSKNAWDKFMKELEALRNKLAHSNSIPSSAWPQISLLALEMEKCLSHLEEQ